MHKTQGINPTDLTKRHRHKFILELARCFLAFGAPTHRVEGQLNSAAKVLSTHAEFLLLPNVIFVSFHDESDSHAATLHVIKQIGGISLSQLHSTHSIFKGVLHHELSAEQGWKQLAAVRDSPLPYSRHQKCFIAFLCGFSITPLAFGGSLVDAVAAGAFAMCLAALALFVASSNPLVAKIFE
jgi:uncharacterized membrane protein YjjP (DUF1212 family)